MVHQARHCLAWYEKQLQDVIPSEKLRELFDRFRLAYPEMILLDCPHAAHHGQNGLNPAQTVLFRMSRLESYVRSGTLIARCVTDPATPQETCIIWQPGDRIFRPDRENVIAQTT